MLIAALVAGLVIVVAGIGSFFASGLDSTPSFEESGAWPADPSAEDLGVPTAPPSERGELPSTSVPQVVDEQDLTSGAARSGDTFNELSCTFTGTSTLERPLALDSAAAPPNRMTLEPGARFECTDGTESSSGTLELTADFETLSFDRGIGAGEGRITWTELPEARRVPGELAAESVTGVEVQLQLPVIVVWTTIVDGPYAGYRGRLVLRDWEPLTGEGGITGTRFATTSTTFAPG